ncbi:MAG: M16 family metallopeptidase [Acidimicrobiales bacterium]
MTFGPRPTLPDPGPYPSVTLGVVSDVQTPNGMRVVAVRRPQVPLVQIRLQVPLGDVRVRDGAALRLLPKMLLAGTGARSGSEVAAAIQRIGATLGVSEDPDHLSFAAAGPAGRLEELLELLGEIVALPSFPRGEIVGERERVAQEVVQEAADPIALATRALWAELFPGHPYAEPLPGIASVRRTGRSSLSRFHETHLQPSGSALVVVGDVDPDRVIDIAHGTLGTLPAGPGADGARTLDPPSPPAGGGGILVVHRPGAVQSNLRIGARCAGRHDPSFPALLIATTVLGGSFMSRLVTNLRERNGYTYSPRAVIDERRLAAAATVRAEVATEVTAKALAEVLYELARMATAEVTAAELDSSRRYVAGVVAMAASTQAELASLLASLVSNDLDPSYLESFLRDLADLDTGLVSTVARRALGPAAMTTVVVGDADLVTEPLSSLDRVRVVAL